MPNTTRVLQLRRGDRAVLESWLRSRTLPRRLLERAEIILAAADGQSSRAIVASTGITRPTVLLWIRRYATEGLAGIEQDRPRSGRPRKVTPEVEEAVIERTVTTTPPADVATHWSTRLLAKMMGLNHHAVGRIWRKYALKPHQIRRFKLSRDPRLVEKIHDVVGLYLNPPVNAVVFSIDEKSQMQALDRTQPGLPLKEGASRDHDARLQA